MIKRNVRPLVALKAISIGLFVAGLGLLGPLVYFQLRDDSQRSHVNASPQTIVRRAVLKPATITGKPVTLRIPSLHITLAVADGVYNAHTGQWTLSSDKAHFALISQQPNDEQGNTFLYGHYRPKVFARLHLIQPHAEAIVVTDNGYEFRYTLREVLTKQPTETDIFQYQGPPILTIQTCSGAWMQNRQFFQFDYAGLGASN